MTTCKKLTDVVALAAVAGVVALAPAASAEAGAEGSPFSGSWSGPWTVFEAGAVVASGTFEWTSSDAGQLTGRVYHAQSGRSGAVKGHVDDDGKIVMIGFAPADDPQNGNGIPFQGLAAIDDDTLVVSMSRTDSNRTLAAVLERNQVSDIQHKFAGTMAADGDGTIVGTPDAGGSESFVWLRQ